MYIQINVFLGNFWVKLKSGELMYIHVRKITKKGNEIDKRGQLENLR